jgi:hypothetical protein
MISMIFTNFVNDLLSFPHFITLLLMSVYPILIYSFDQHLQYTYWQDNIFCLVLVVLPLRYSHLSFLHYLFDVINFLLAML